MKDVIDKLDEWTARGERAAIATVVSVKRSAPRPPGAKMAVNEKGDVWGAVSGGCVEGAVVMAAEEVLEGGPPRLLHFGIADEEAWDVGLPCGGEIDVFIEPYQGAESDVVLTVIAGGEAGEKLHDSELEQAARRRGRSHVFEHEGRTVYADVSVPPPRLFVYGAIDTAEALCAAAKLIGWRTIVADARPRFATAERMPSADEILVLWPDEALAQVMPDAATAVVVVTHDDKFDLPLVRGALDSEAFYVGWLGSHRNQARRRGLLLEEGVAEEELDRISGPAGLDLGASSREETAISILAEILAARTGRSGAPLRETNTRIHA
jgi:xanthine dehydrogenase accessory factor